MDEYKEIEKSLIKKYRKDIWSKFVKAVIDYKLISDLKKVNPNVDYNIFKSLDNVNLNCILGTKKDGKYTSFLDKYEK